MCPEQQEVSLAVGDHLASLKANVRFPREVTATPVTRCPERGIAFKFGGSSLLGADRMLHAAVLVREAAAASPVTVVVSAMKGVTDTLLEIAGKLARQEFTKAREAAQDLVMFHLGVLEGLQLPEHDHAQVLHELKLLARDLLHETPQRGPVAVDPALFDRLASFGERFCARLLAAALNKLGFLGLRPDLRHFPGRETPSRPYQRARPRGSCAIAGIGHRAGRYRFHRRDPRRPHYHTRSQQLRFLWRPHRPRRGR